MNHVFSPRHRLARSVGIALAVLPLVFGTAAAQTPADAAAQSPARDAHSTSEALFYRAFFVDRGLEDKDRALVLYRQFLAAEPDHPLSGQAARFAIQILRASERAKAAQALADKHAAVLAETVPAGINAGFLDPNADAARFVGRFESESREIFQHRRKILALLDLQPGQAVADVGAGTGLYTNLFAREVGESGKVYAVDISPVLIEHLRGLAKTMKLPQVEVVHCTSNSSKLPPASVDLVFICDTYHHFEHPAETMASIHSALRPGGQVVLIDFDRIPGKSREWLLDHVRAGREVFQAEVEKAGFELVQTEAADYLKENYILRFAKK